MSILQAMLKLSPIFELEQLLILQQYLQYRRTSFILKMVLDISLSTQQLSGTEKEKARIGFAITANGDGTERPQMWIIGSAKKPRCFNGINTNNLGIKWRANKKAWMTVIITKEWPGWFWSYIRAKKPGKRVLLLVNNYSAHTKALEDLKEENSVILNDIEILFLPPNTTSRYQPCDQGIINTFKLHYVVIGLDICSGNARKAKTDEQLLMFSRQFSGLSKPGIAI